MGTNLATASTICPFCKGAIPADTIRFGGNCPHCLLEIPGEEAPTDPGKIARLRAEAEAQRSRRSRVRRNAVLAVVLMLMTVAGGAAGYLQWQKQQEALVMELDDFYMVPLEQLQTAPKPEATPAPTTEAKAGPAVKRPPRGSQSNPGSPATPSSSGPDGAAAQAPAMKGPSSSAPTGDALPAELAAKTTVTPGGGFGEVDIGVSRMGLGDKTLADEAEIFEMAKRVINSTTPQMTSCYNQRLKQVDGLQGAWKLSFVIARDGTTKNVSVSGVNMQDAELESCMSRAVAAWKFQKIAKDQPVNKTYRFAPQNAW
ncbi:MAG: AgmX/PglI C-terminal domain-containing protein [Myxococcota bacterium]